MEIIIQRDIKSQVSNSLMYNFVSVQKILSPTHTNMFIRCPDLPVLVFCSCLSYAHLGCVPELIVADFLFLSHALLGLQKYIKRRND